MPGFADEVAATFHLGQPRRSVTVRGGLSNDLWRVETDMGDFAVKVMRANARNPEFRANIEAAFAIEAQARRRGVPCPAPVAADGGHCLAEVSGELVRVHRWVDGKTVDGSRWGEEAGALVAQIHQADEPFMASLDGEPWDTEGWASLADNPDMSEDLARDLLEAAPALARLERVTAAPGLETPHINTRGDLDPKNTLAVDGHLMALDWDAAGPQPRVRDVASVALDWSATLAEFRGVLGSYLRHDGEPVPAEPWVLGGWVSALGGWLVFNATSRPLGPRGQREIRSTCERLVALGSGLDLYLDAMRLSE